MPNPPKPILPPGAQRSITGQSWDRKPFDNRFDTARANYEVPRHVKLPDPVPQNGGLPEDAEFVGPGRTGWEMPIGPKSLRDDRDDLPDDQYREPEPVLPIINFNPLPQLVHDEGPDMGYEPPPTINPNEIARIMNVKPGLPGLDDHLDDEEPFDNRPAWLRNLR